MKSAQALTLEILFSLKTAISGLFKLEGEERLPEEVRNFAVCPKKLRKLDLYRFVDFVETYVVAIKIAHESRDYYSTHELLGELLAKLEEIGEFSEEDSVQVRAVAAMLGEKEIGKSKKEHEKRMKEILKLARKIKLNSEDPK